MKSDGSLVQAAREHLESSRKFSLGDHPAQPPEAPAHGLPKGYDARKAIPLFDFLTKYFPLAIVEVTKIAVAGNAQHNPGEPLHWARGKSMDQLNTAMRHIFDHGMGTVYDTEPAEVEAAIGGKTMHLAKAAWRLLAEIQLLCEAREREEAASPVIVVDVVPPHHGHGHDDPTDFPDRG
jgi:hypothetical protein